jgi:formiminotetrahydrofolate cyclodeaminase
VSVPGGRTRDVDFLALALGAFHDALEEPESLPASGAVAATSAALSSSLVAMAARASPDWPEGTGVAAQALKLRRRLAELARTDAEAFAAVLSQLDTPGSERGRDARLARALDRSSELPLAIAETAADVAALAALTADRCVQRHRADAVAAAALAEGAAVAAAHLVTTNLLSIDGDERSARAHAAAEAAGAARRLAERST